MTGSWYFLSYSKVVIAVKLCYFMCNCVGSRKVDGQREAAASPGEDPCGPREAAGTP